MSSNSRPDTMACHLYTVLFCSMLCLLQLAAASIPDPPIPRPDHTDHARLARWLAHYNTWGTLSTQGANGSPSAGVVSFADGPLSGEGAGRLFFYLTPMDETGHGVQDNPDCALSVSEAQLHPNGCGAIDPMEPTCARITVLGRMLPLEATDAAMAQRVLFDKHPAMKTWPADHGFSMYELHLREIHMLDWYGGMHVISPEDYFVAGLQPQQQQGGQQLQRQHRQNQQQQQQQREPVGSLLRKLPGKLRVLPGISV